MNLKYRAAEEVYHVTPPTPPFQGGEKNGGSAPNFPPLKRGGRGGRSRDTFLLRHGYKGGFGTRSLSVQASSVLAIGLAALFFLASPRPLSAEDAPEQTPAAAEAGPSLPMLKDGVAEVQKVGPWLEKRLPAYMNESAFLLKNWQWLGLLVLIALGVLLDRLVGWLVIRLCTFWLKRRKVEVPEQAAKRVERPVGLAAMAALWWMGLHGLDLPTGVYEFLARIGVFFLAAAGVWAAYRLVDVLGAYLAELASRTPTKMDDLLVPLVRKTLKIFVVVFGLVFVAGNLGMDISTMLTGLGIGGLAVALASKDTVENLFGSFTVLLDRPFQIGDGIALLGIEGTVEEVGFRSTRLRTAQGSAITIPNSKLVSATIENHGPRERSLFRCTFLLKAPTVPEKVETLRAAVRELFHKLPQTSALPAQVYVSDFSGPALKIQVLGYVHAERVPEQREVRERLLLELQRLALEQGVELA